MDGDTEEGGSWDQVAPSAVVPSSTRMTGSGELLSNGLQLYKTVSSRALLYKPVPGGSNTVLET